MDADLTRKLKMMSGQRILLLNAPDGYIERLMPLPKETDLDVKPEGSYDLIHLFVSSVADLQQWASKAIQTLKYNAYFWISYPKKSSKIKTDLSRDAGWNVVTEEGYEGVALISIDETWSAMRFRRVDLVKGTSSRREAGSQQVAADQTKDRILEIPDDFQSLLNTNGEARAFYDSLSYTYRKEYVEWIIGAKREETRKGRLDKTLEKLKSGIKSPFSKV